MKGAVLDRMDDPVTFALDLAEVVRMLQAVPTTDAPPGANRARPLAAYDEATRAMIRRAGHLINASTALDVWEEALAAPPHQGTPVWVQGDLEGNCLVEDGRLRGIVDWGSACAGDPAVDVQVVWSPLFDGESRRVSRRPRCRRRHARSASCSPGPSACARPAHVSSHRRALLAQARRARSAADHRCVAAVVLDPTLNALPSFGQDPDCRRSLSVRACEK